MLFVIFFFPPFDPPLDPTKPSPLPPSPLYVQYLHKAGLFTIEIFYCEPWPTKKAGSPLLALYAAELLMLSLMVADGRRQPLALGLGARRSFNKSKSVPLHQYFGSITVKVRWRRRASAG